MMMTVRRSRVYSLSISALIAGTLTLFSVGWMGFPLPLWVDDLRWILLIVGVPAAWALPIVRRLETNAESFRLGIAVGQHRQIEDLPAQDAGTRPHHKRG